MTFLTCRAPLVAADTAPPFADRSFAMPGSTALRLLALAACCGLPAGAASAGETAGASAAPAAATLQVRVEGLASSEGVLLAALHAGAASWDGQGRPAAGQRLAARQGSMELVFEDVAPGRYGLLVLHDANGNGRMDSNFLGIPSEGYGFSNNPRLLRRARFDEVAFEVPAGGARILVELR